jgi:hypothetical protein
MRSLVEGRVRGLRMNQVLCVSKSAAHRCPLASSRILDSLRWQCALELAPPSCAPERGPNNQELLAASKPTARWLSLTDGLKLARLARIQYLGWMMSAFAGPP